MGRSQASADEVIGEHGAGRRGAGGPIDGDDQSGHETQEKGERYPGQVGDEQVHLEPSVRAHAILEELDAGEHHVHGAGDAVAD